MKLLKHAFIALSVLTLAACQTGAPKSASASGGKGYSDLLDSIFEQEREWAGLTTKTINAKGLNIAYSEGGPADGEVIVFLHGFTADRNNWNRTLRYLTKSYRVLVPDLPGHGDSSSGLELDYSMAEMAGVMKAFVDTLGLEKYHIAGNSLGGGLAIQWGVFRPHQLKSLILIDSAGLYEHETPMIRDMKAGKNELLTQKKGDLRRTVNKVMGDVPFLPRELFDEMEQRQIDRYPIYKKMADTLNETQKSMGPGAFSIALKSLRVPVLIIWGDQDPVFDVAVVKEIQKPLRQSEVVIMEGIGHVPNFEAPKETAIAIDTFMKKHF